MTLLLKSLTRTSTLTVTAEYLCPDCRQIASRSFSAAQLHRDFTIPLQRNEVPRHECRASTGPDRIKAFIETARELRLDGYVERVTVEL